MLDLQKHAAFHIAEITRVPQLTEIITGLQDQMRWFLAAQAADGGPMPPKQNHHRLVDAVRRADQEEARAITAESVALSREQLLQRIMSFELT